MVMVEGDRMKIERVAESVAMREVRSLQERLESRSAAVPVTVRGRPVFALLPWEDYEALGRRFTNRSDGGGPPWPAPSPPI